MSTEEKQKEAKKKSSQVKSQEPIREPLPKEMTPEEEQEEFNERIRICTDSTPVQEFTFVHNTSYSREIIDGVRESVNLEKLMSLKKNRAEFLKEGAEQIKTLWHGIHGLIVHSEMFTVLFLIAMGVIQIEMRKMFTKLSEFTKWRDATFDVRHKRWLQIGVQLAEMGNFPRKYASLGKKRILQLESIRKREGLKSCEEIFALCPPDEEITFKSIPDEVIQKMDIEPFPDISYDLEEDLVKEYVDSVITFHRLKNVGIDFADFDHAKLITHYYEQAIPVEDATQIQTWLSEQEEEKREKLFNDYVKDRGRFPSKKGSGYKFSLNKVVGDILKICSNIKFDDNDWFLERKDIIDKTSLSEAVKYLTLILEKYESSDNENSDSDEGKEVEDR